MQHLFAKITFTLESESVLRFHRNLSLSALGVGETVDISIMINRIFRSWLSSVTILRTVLFYVFLLV